MSATATPSRRLHSSGIGPSEVFSSLSISRRQRAPPTDVIIVAFPIFVSRLFWLVFPGRFISSVCGRRRSSLLSPSVDLGSSELSSAGSVMPSSCCALPIWMRRMFQGIGKRANLRRGFQLGRFHRPRFGNFSDGSRSCLTDARLGGLDPGLAGILVRLIGFIGGNQEVVVDCNG